MDMMSLRLSDVAQSNLLPSCAMAARHAQP